MPTKAAAGLQEGEEGHKDEGVEQFEGEPSSKLARATTCLPPLPLAMVARLFTFPFWAIITTSSTWRAAKERCL